MTRWGLPTVGFSVNIGTNRLIRQQRSTSGSGRIGPPPVHWRPHGAAVKRQKGAGRMFQMTFPDFSGKIVLIYLVNRSDDYNVVMQHATLENQAGKIFIVGEFAEGTTASDWAAGIRTAVSWENVEQYLVFDSIEDYYSRMSIGWDDRTVQ
jgi:hypothetical protein